LAVLGLQLPDALVLRCQRFAYAVLAQLLRFTLRGPAPDGALTNLHILADLADTQPLDFDHLSHLELEARVKDTSGFLLVHFYRRLGLK
jgi:hypothetical protein